MPSPSKPPTPRESLLTRGVELALGHLYTPEQFLERFPPEKIMDAAAPWLRGKILNDCLNLNRATGEQLDPSHAGPLLATALRAEGTSPALVLESFGREQRLCLPAPALWSFLYDAWWMTRHGKTDTFIIAFLQEAISLECLTLGTLQELFSPGDVLRTSEDLALIVRALSLMDLRERVIDPLAKRLGWSSAPVDDAPETVALGRSSSRPAGAT